MLRLKKPIPQILQQVLKDPGALSHAQYAIQINSFSTFRFRGQGFLTQQGQFFQMKKAYPPGGYEIVGDWPLWTGAGGVELFEDIMEEEIYNSPFILNDVHFE